MTLNFFSKCLRVNLKYTIYFLFFPLFVLAQPQDKPVIGITSFVINEGESSEKIATRSTYIDAILEGGGVPVIIPSIKNNEFIDYYVQYLDGLVLVGGYDVPPSLYKEKAHSTVQEMSQRRWQSEIELVRLWIEKTSKPILGICLGLQLSNVVMGGSLIQDIPSQTSSTISHRSLDKFAHMIKIDKDSQLFQILQVSRLNVNSFHHQCVKELAPIFNAVAWSEDGLIEAIEFKSSSRFGIFLQWHPEKLIEEESSKRIFNAFLSNTKASVTK